MREYSQYAKYSNQVYTNQLNITNISSLGHAFPPQNIKTENRGVHEYSQYIEMMQMVP